VLGQAIGTWQFLTRCSAADCQARPFWDTPLNQGLSVFVGLALCTTMLGLGCTVELSQLGGQLRRPVGVLLALLCQFVLMPLLAFLLALLFALDEVAAVAVLLCGCCPGGNLSNIMSLLVNGDMNLRYPTRRGRCLRGATVGFTVV
uniref:Solute carrier family 10 member 6 n=1 Tax=Terrapene triunguis TaxID=2587831 RepID=A0A674K814_9SAUR